MSYHFDGYFRTKAGALAAVTNSRRSLPHTIVHVLAQAINNLPADTDDKFIHVKAVGHQLCSDAGGGSYEQSTADLCVRPLSFFREN